jgi:hypothetical protein
MVTKRKLGIVRMWVGRPAAEHEVIERIKRAASVLGVEVVEIDHHGRYLDNREKEIAPGDVDFVIHPHFETAKIYDAFSYGALWNPLHFYFKLGYEQHARNQSSHDGFLTVGCRWAEDIVLREFGGLDRGNFVRFDLSLADVVYRSGIRDDRTLFYCGMNWERYWGTKRGNHGVLQTLDQADLLSVYGPPEAWSGFRNYKGLLPFDGRSVVDAIHACGIQLVLLSEAHQISDMSSSRLLEGVASGAMIISGRYDCAQRVFGDAALYVDDDAEPTDMANQIREHVEWINREPEAASEMIDAAQDIFADHFRLDRQLAKLIEQHSSQLDLRGRTVLSRTESLAIDIVYPDSDAGTLDLEEVRQIYEASIYQNFRLHFVAHNACETVHQALGRSLHERVRFHDVRPPRKGRRWGTGSVIAAIWAELKGDILIVANGNERMFHDCLSKIVRRFEDDPDLAVTVSDYIAMQLDDCGREQRHFVGVEGGVVHAAALANHAVRRSAYDSVRSFADYLDGPIWCDMLLLAFAKRSRQIGHSGFMIDIDAFERAEELRAGSVITSDEQLVLVRRYLARTGSPFADQVMENRLEPLVRTLSSKRDGKGKRRPFKTISDRFRRKR